MSIKRNQSGFGHLALPLLVLVVLVIGFSAYTVWHKQHQTSNDTNNSTTATVSIPAKIKTKADLHQASQALVSANQQMQSQLNSSALNSSINKLL